MKELSIEDKAKRYDEAVKKLKVLHDDWAESQNRAAKEVEEIFPELKESEDEKIRKEIMDFIDTQTINSDERRNRWFSYLEKYKPIPFMSLEDTKVKMSLMQYISELNQDVVHLHPGIETCNSWFAWLEKQGEQKPVFEMKTPEESLGIDSGTYNKIVDECIYGEQKPANKVEPKFKIEEGKWYICISQFCNCIEGRVYKATFDSRIIDDFGTEYDMHNDAYKYFRLWTIKDAKDGDVLVCEDFGYTSVMLFESFSNGRISLHCWYNGQTNNFHINTDVALRKDANIHPATKEQRDQLERAMTNAGYIFDFEKKELKKIEQKSAWSEEDENFLKEAIKMIEMPGSWFKGKDLQNKIVNWLKSLKDRIQPQPKQEWKQKNTNDLTDFENAMMHIGGSFFGENAGLDPNDTNAIKEQANVLLGLALKQEWSEEDERILRTIEGDIKQNLSCCTTTLDDYYQKQLDWLKSLRPQNTWKPSGFHLECIEDAISLYEKHGINAIGLKEILDELKKLKS